MAWSDELQQRRLVLRPYLRFAGSDNPSVSGYVGGTFMYGSAADNVGPIPVRGTAMGFGRLGRSVANDLVGLESPQSGLSLVDKNNQWRQWARRPSTLDHARMQIGLRVRSLGTETYVDGTLIDGLAKDFTMEAGQVAFTLYDTLGELYGRKVPRKLINLADWRVAPPGSLNRPYPIIYGRCDGEVGDLVTGVAASIGSPSGVSLSSVTSDPTDFPGDTEVQYYALAPAFNGRIVGPTTVVPATPNSGEAVTLTWATSAGIANEVIIFRSFPQEWSFRNGATRVTVPIADGTFTDYPKGGHPDGWSPGWSPTGPESVQYWVTATIAGAPFTAKPVTVNLWMFNRDAVRPLTLTWDAVAGATAITVRRAAGTTLAYPVPDREWTLAGAATSLTDWLDDLSVQPTAIPNPGLLPGVVECIPVQPPGYVVGPSGTFDYVVAGHPCHSVRRVYVTTNSTMPGATLVGGIDAPTGLAGVVGGTPGSTHRSYVITAINAYGETTPTFEMVIDTTPDTLTGVDNVALTWNAVDDAIGYRVYRQDPAALPGQIAEVADPAFTDTGATPSAVSPPTVNGTAPGGQFGGLGTIPVLMSPDTGDGLGDYTTSLVTVGDLDVQMLHFKWDPGSNPVTADVWGVMDEDDNLIEGYYEAFADFLQRFVGIPTANIDLTSFTAAQIASEARLDGGYTVAGVMSDQTEVQEAIYRWIAGTDADFYYWLGQIKVKLPTPSPSGSIYLSPENGGILESNGFHLSIDASNVWAHLPWAAGAQAGGYRYAGVNDQLSGSPYVGDRIGPALSLHWVRDPAVVTDLILRLTARRRTAMVRATFSVPFRYVVAELSDWVYVTHPDGLGATADGWVNELVRIVRSDVDIGGQQVLLTVEAQPSSE